MCLISSCLRHFDSVTVVRDLDGYIYFRENEGSLLAGGFEPIAKPAFEDGTIPGKTESKVQSSVSCYGHTLLVSHKILKRMKATQD
jgi:pyruvate dehydrogenase phosphatase regulatory subunit